METGLPAAALATGDDVHSALARLKYVIHVLRNCYICEGWKLDEEGAEHALKHFRLAGAEPQYGGLSRAGSLAGRPGWRPVSIRKMLLADDPSAPCWVASAG